jgi:hypothetical protein
VNFSQLFPLALTTLSGIPKDLPRKNRRKVKLASLVIIYWASSVRVTKGMLCAPLGTPSTRPPVAKLWGMISVINSVVYFFINFGINYLLVAGKRPFHSSMNDKK